MSLTDSQRKHLRGLGHSLKPLVLVGSGGLSKPVLAEITNTLAYHELIKIRVRSGDREIRDALIQEVVSRSAAELVQQTGNVALLYRVAEKPRIALP